jgi:apolipoprotein N-acyltransferase
MTFGPTTRAVVLGVVSGLLYLAAHPPAGAGALAFVALVPLLVAVRGRSVATGFLAGWVAGTIACNGLTTASIFAALMRARHPPWLAGVEALVVPQLYGALWFAVFGAYAAALARRQPRASDVLVLPAAWVAGELVRSRLGDGMPWVLLAHAQTASPTLLQVADVTGAYGVSFVVAVVNAAIVTALVAADRARRAGLVAALVVAAAVGYGRVQLVRWERPGGAALHVAVVQGAIPDGWRESLARQQDAVARYRTLVERAARDRPALVVLPENAVGVAPATNPDVLAEIARPLAGSNAMLVVGGPRVVSTESGRASVRNAAYLVDEGGAVRGVYDKLRLVPFGETPPWLLPRSLRERLALPDDYSPGDTPTILRHADVAIGPAVCWEGIYAELVRPQVRAGATLLASLSNDDWFGGRAAVEQHFRATLLRAVETRRWLVRATNTGVTAIVDPRGVAVVAPRAEAVVLPGRVTLETGVTAYVWFGDVFAWVCCGVAVIGLAWRGTARRASVAACAGACLSFATNEPIPPACRQGGRP